MLFIEEMIHIFLILNIFEIGKLYVQELLAELLRKEEGLWPVRFKHAIARFKEKKRLRPKGFNLCITALNTCAEFLVYSLREGALLKNNF